MQSQTSREREGREGLGSEAVPDPDVHKENCLFTLVSVTPEVLLSDQVFHLKHCQLL